MNIKDVTEGMRLVADGGFTCLDKGQVVEVVRDVDGDLAFRCKGGGLHLLDGQVDEGGEIVGLQRADQELIQGAVGREREGWPS